MKVVERVFESRLSKVLDIDGNQLGFMPGRGTIDGIFAVRQWIRICAWSLLIWRKLLTGSQER